jgi:L-ectoine synthase
VIVRTLDEVVGSEDDVHAEGWNSRRLLLARHGMGFSMHDTLIHAGAALELWYKHHLEAVYCVAGMGEIECLTTGRRWSIGAGTIYALDANDRHVLRATETMRMVCVFNPPVTGREVHDADGAYALPEEPARSAERA